MKKGFVILLFIIINFAGKKPYSAPPAGRILYVSPSGSDSSIGSLAHPYHTIAAALRQVSGVKEEQVAILLRGGDYYLDSTLVIDQHLLHGHHLTIAAYAQEKPVIKGSRKLTVKWKTYRGPILQVYVGKEIDPDQLYCNGKSLPMARYPNYDPAAAVFNGTSPDAISPERVQKWQHPAGGYVHALHEGEWGSFHYRITDADSTGHLRLKGGWQMNRPALMHARYRFVENIFEELDAPGEWYYNKQQGMLYLIPPTNLDLSAAVFEYSLLNDLLVIKGTPEQPVKNVRLEGLSFTETNRTFMLTKEPLLRSDWTIYRGGAVLLDGAEHTSVRGCHFEELGGNAVFLSNYNREDTIEDNEIDTIGASAICLAGNTATVRSPSFDYDRFASLDSIDLQPGPRSPDYPARCLVYNNLVHRIGTIEKQVAGVTIDMAFEITVSHNTIYQTPRSGINIGDGCWGGHVIEYNNVFNTVLETGDHGAFNAWGRDRYWQHANEPVDSLVRRFPRLPLADAMKPIILRNNLFYCTHGWDIDLDDGSSNYHIYDNLCLNGGLKLRQGYARTVENNIIVNNSFHPHVWYQLSNDVFRYNIVGADYAPIGITSWGKQVDSNFFSLETSLRAARENHTDKHSRSGDVQFVDPSINNYTVKPGSPALATGFRNFSMDRFGVVDARLKARAEKAPTPGVKVTGALKKGETKQWGGAEIKNIEGMNDRSAAGLFDEMGVWVIRVTPGSLTAKSGLKPRDVIRSINHKPVSDVNGFLSAIQIITWQGQASVSIIRDQKEQNITLWLQ